MDLKEEKFIIPQNEIKENFSRSSGAGGQNVNRVSTKAEVRWNINESKAFTDEQKEEIKKELANRINKKGDLIIVSQEERTQGKNRELAVGRLNDLVKFALIPEKERVPTKPTKSSKEKRIKEKKRVGRKKKSRSQKINIEEE